MEYECSGGGAVTSDYTFEVRRRNGSRFDYLGSLDKRVQPSISREMGLADTLSFNLPLSDPNAQLFPPWGSLKGLEVWWYGRDRNLKQVFVPQVVEPYRDYGGTSSGSGSGALGSGSGDFVLISCDGPESYLTRYYTSNYKVSQRLPVDILNDITIEARADGIFGACSVDPSLNIPIDIDLSWENVQTAVGNIIAQTGGYIQIQCDPKAPSWRVLYIFPIPGQLPQPKDAGATSAVLPQARRGGT